jgi:DNA ligase (NAD+)
MYEEIKYLIEMDNLYHNGEEVPISDYEYDILKSEARDKHPNHPYFKTVGATPTGNKVDLPFVCGSLEKMKYDGSMNQWIQDSGVKEIAISDKLDGCTIIAEFMDGTLMSASTRGDGYQGRDITEKARIFCPEAMGTGHVILKGEVLATTKITKELGYKKSRTFVAGCLNRDGIRNAEHMEVVFYRVMNKELHTFVGHITEISSMGLPTVFYGSKIVKDTEDMEVFLAEYYSDRKATSRWDIDGLVVTDYYDADNQDEYYPMNEVAFKVNEDAVRTTVEWVQWEVKRSGKIQPIVHIKPVDISGSEVTKCTGFNYKFIRDNEIDQGAEIGIVLSGEIIPYITDVYKEAKQVDSPEYCLSCGAKLGVSASGVDLVCLNPNCEGKLLYKLENFLLANGVEEVTSTTIKKIGINSIIELMELDEMDLAGIEGFGASRINTILEQIQRVYQTTPANLLKSFGITGLGKTMSAELIHKFGDMETVFSLGWIDLIEMDGVGEVMANRILNELPEYRELYDYLVENGLTFEEKTGDALKGKKITLTGKSEIKRNDLIKAIESQGGMVKGMSKQVDYLFTNSPNSTTTKMKKAQAYGISIMGYDELYKMLGMEVDV